MFNEDDRGSFIKRVYFLLRTQFHYSLFFKKKFAFIKSMPRVWGIWNVVVHGPNISLGENVVISSADGYRTTISTIKMAGHEGRIAVGNNVLIMNGVRISSAASIEIGDGSMLANRCYLTDADWHDIYDRTKPVGRAAPIVLGKGVWIGDSAIVLKGVRIGENSIIGAGSVVRSDIPANVIAAGNPAAVVKKIDGSKVKLAGSS